MCATSWDVVRPNVPGPCITCIGYSIPPDSSGVSANEYDGHGYGPNRREKSFSTFTTLSRYGPGASPTCRSTATLTATPPSAVPVTTRKSPIDIAQSGTPDATQWPGASDTPVASTCEPAGTTTSTSK